MAAASKNTPAPRKRRRPQKVPGPGIVLAGGTAGVVLAGGLSLVPNKALAAGIQAGLGVLGLAGAMMLPKRHKEMRIALAAAGVVNLAAGILVGVGWALDKWMPEEKGRKGARNEGGAVDDDDDDDDDEAGAHEDDHDDDEGGIPMGEKVVLYAS